jgi:hypothetical protein
LEHFLGDSFSVGYRPTWIFRKSLIRAWSHVRDFAGAGFDDDVVTYSECLLAGIWPHIAIVGCHRDGDQVGFVLDVARRECPPVLIAEGGFDLVLAAEVPLRLRRLQKLLGLLG